MPFSVPVDLNPGRYNLTFLGEPTFQIFPPNQSSATRVAELKMWCQWEDSGIPEDSGVLWHWCDLVFYKVKWERFGGFVLKCDITTNRRGKQRELQPRVSTFITGGDESAQRATSDESWYEGGQFWRFLLSDKSSNANYCAMCPYSFIQTFVLTMGFDNNCTGEVVINNSVFGQFSIALCSSS